MKHLLRFLRDIWHGPTDLTRLAHADECPDFLEPPNECDYTPEQVRAMMRAVLIEDAANRRYYSGAAAADFYLWTHEPTKSVPHE